MDQSDLCYVPATELVRLYRSGQLSPVEVTQATLDRIERLNPILNAYVTVTAELALAQARQAEQRYRDGGDMPAIAGVPVSLKDLTPTKGIRTTRGSLLYKDWVPDYDVPMTERIYAAGGVLLGKTNTPELGWKGDSGNRVVGPTYNPWHHERSAGGSSGGAAAAVAAGLGPLAQGTDGAGSIRMPASFCGVYGLKPSFGLIPYVPASAVESLAHAGPLTRTVRDSALFLNVLAGPDARDRNSLNAQGIDYLTACDGSVAGLRVGWSRDLGFAAIDPEVADIAEKAASVFEQLGCNVVDVQATMEDPYPVLDVIWSTGMAFVHRDNLDQVRDLIDPGRLKVVEAGMKVSGVDLAAAHARRAEIYEEYRQFMAPYDILLTPTMPIGAFRAGDDFPPRIAGKSVEYLSWTAFTYPFNLTGQPAATVPCGFTSEGLPVGLQIVGRWRDDATVLRASAAFEAARPWSGSPPPLND